MAGSTHWSIEVTINCANIDWNKQDARSFFSHLQAEPIEPAERVRASHFHSSIHTASKKQNASITGGSASLQMNSTC
jgi:hypothetical protein